MKFILVTLFTFFFVGCATTQKISQLPTQKWESGIYDVHAGEKISEAELFSRVQNADYLLVGESHDSAKDHGVQLRVVEKLGKDSLVGFEMFQRPFQPILDRFAKDEISEEEMLIQTQWKKRWGFHVEMYAPIWASAKSLDANLVALNLRRELTKRISSQGIEGLSIQEKADLVEYDLSDLAYRNWLQEIFESHGAKMSEKKMQNFYEAQILWDETMADSAVEAMKAQDAKRIIMLVGRGHFEWDWGIPSRVRRRLGVVYGNPKVKVLIPSEGKLPNIETLKKRRFADFIWVH